MTIKIKKITTTKYIDIEENQEYQFNPVEDSISIEKTETGYKMKYLVQDEHYETPDSWGDDSLFLVHYHRDFWIERKDITKDILCDIYRQDGDYLETLNEFWWFPVSALIHSGVWLSMSKNFSCDPGGWDTSHVGGIFCKKTEFTDKETAYKAAECLLQEWNFACSGDVYGCVVETLNQDKKNVNTDSVWGFYGYKYAMESLNTEF